MFKKIFLVFQERRKKAKIRKKIEWLYSPEFQKELDEIDLNQELDEDDVILLKYLKESQELKDIPEFDVKKGWEEFEKYYLPIAEELIEKSKKKKDN